MKSAGEMIWPWNWTALKINHAPMQICGSRVKWCWRLVLDNFQKLHQSISSLLGFLFGNIYFLWEKICMHGQFQIFMSNLGCRQLYSFLYLAPFASARSGRTHRKAAADTPGRIFHCGNKDTIRPGIIKIIDKITCLKLRRDKLYWNGGAFNWSTM